MSTKKWSGAKSCVQGDKQIKKWKEGSDDLRARSHPAQFPIYRKKLKKSLEPCVVGHTSNPSTGKAQAFQTSEFEVSLVYTANY